MDLTLENNKVTVLLGLSGSGKSTVLKAFLGLVQACSGQVLIDGIPIEKVNITEQRQNIGYMTQNGGLFPHLTVEENITILVKHLSWDKNSIRERLTELLDLTHLSEDLLNRYPIELSGGQRQRASLIRALMHNPVTIFLDEPLGALDPMTRFDLQVDLKQIFKKLNNTVVLVTHDLLEAKYLANDIHILKDGKIIQSGSYNNLKSNPKNEYIKKFFTAAHSDHES